MIRSVSGDILLSGAHAMAHGVAPGDHFSSGLALQLRERWPAMVRDYRHWCHDRNPKPGEVWFWGGPEGTRIVNLLTQEPSPDHHRHGHPGQANTEYVSHALKALSQMAREEAFTSLALPRLATGVGGLRWEDVEPLIRQHLGDLGIPVIVYTTFQQGVRADEGLTPA